MRTNLLEHVVLVFLGHGGGRAIAQKTCKYGMQKQKEEQAAVLVKLRGPVAEECRGRRERRDRRPGFLGVWCCLR